MKNTHNGLILTLCVLAAVILAACTPYSSDLSRKHGIDGARCTPRELSKCYRAANSHLKQETGDSIRFLVVANSGLAARSFIDTVADDTVDYRVMWFLVRIDNNDKSSSGVEFPLYFTPDLGYWNEHLEDYIHDIRAAK